MQRQHYLLRFGLHGHNAHARLLARRPDRLRIRGICLVALNERPDFARRGQAHLMPQLRQSVSPLMRAAAGLHHQERWFTDSKPFEQASPLELQPFYAARVVHHPMQLEQLLGDIDRNNGRVHDGLLCSKTSHLGPGWRRAQASREGGFHTI